MSRTMAGQFQWAVMNSRAFGSSKYNDRKNHASNDKTYSHKSMKGRLDAAKDLGKYISTNYPECRMARDVTPDMINKWLEGKAANGCTQDTLNTAASNARFLIRACGSAFGSFNGFDPKEINTPQEDPSARHSNRDAEGMTRKDFDALKASVKQGSTVDKALTIGVATGARSEGICKLTGADIRINGDTATVYIHGEKGGRDRPVDVVKPDYIEALRELKEQAGDGLIITNRKTGGHLKPESLQKALNRAIDKVSLSKDYKGTTTHAIRKLYANERYHAYRGNHGKYETIQYVNVQLGHGKDRDEALLGHYVADIN